MRKERGGIIQKMVGKKNSVIQAGTLHLHPSNGPRKPAVHPESFDGARDERCG